MEDFRGISFVDDVTWLAEGVDLDDVIRKLERCAEASLRWADSNAVRFETTKTEAILFSRKRKHHQCHRGVRVRGQTVHFAGEATRWLGIWLDSSLSLAENRCRWIGKTRQAEARLRRIVSTYGVPPAAARGLQMAIVQGTMLYASELTWSGGQGVEGEYQRAINRMGRATLGAFRSTPLGIVSRGGEWSHPSQGTLKLSSGQVRSQAACQTQGWRRRGARGDPRQRGGGPYNTPQGCSLPSTRRHG